MKPSGLLSTAFSKLHRAASNFISGAQSNRQTGARANFFVASAYLESQSRPGFVEQNGLRDFNT